MLAPEETVQTHCLDRTPGTSIKKNFHKDFLGENPFGPATFVLAVHCLPQSSQEISAGLAQLSQPCSDASLRFSNLRHKETKQGRGEEIPLQADPL